MKEIIFYGYKDYKLNLAVWDEVENPKAVVQLLHGMAEHIQRYDDFAKFLNSKGYIVLGDDHRGHGKTAGLEDLGKVPDGDCFFDTVQDEILITKYATETYKLPVIVFGHSYGSFLTQAYIQRNSGAIAGAVLCGSACQNGIDVKAGKMLSAVQQTFFGKDAPANAIRKMSFGAYDAQFIAENKEFAWGNRDDKEREKYLADPMCNFTLSLGFYKSFFRALSKIYRSKNLSNIRKDLPIFIISGDRDPVGGNGKLVSKLYEMYIDAGLMCVSMKLYPEARHEILNELNKEEVYGDVNDFAETCLSILEKSE